MNIKANDIKPNVKGQSDFFSWQLFRWIRKNPTAFRVYAGTWNSIDGIEPERPVFYIGYEREDSHWISARNLRNLCCANQDLKSYSYGPCHDTANWVDVTEAFWSDYMKKGVCAIHGDNAHSWDEKDDGLRCCIHCCETQILKTKMVEVSEWVKL